MLQETDIDHGVALPAVLGPRGHRGPLHVQAWNLCAALLVIALWLATRQYPGVVKDSRLYMVHALNAMLPGRYAGDLYLQYGSQDAFTIYTPLIEPLLARLGVGGAAVVLTVIGEALWLSGLVYLALRLFHDSKICLLAVAFAIALPNDVIFRYGEPYPTPRIFAEGLTLWALGAMLRGRPLRALLALCGAVAIHPLMTLAGFGVLGLYEARVQRLWLLAGGVALLAAASLGFAGVQPFARAFAMFDAEWFAVVTVRDDIALILQWPSLYVLKLGNLLLLAGIAFTVAEPRQRHFLIVTLVVGLAGVGLTLLGGDLLHDVLAVDAQQYRAVWLLHLAANMLVALVVRRGLRGDAPAFTKMVLACTLALQLLANFIPAAYPGATAMLPLAWVVMRFGPADTNDVPLPVRVAGVALMGVAVGVTAILFSYGLADIRDIPGLAKYKLGSVAITFAALGTAWWLATPGPGRGKPGRTIVALAAAAVLVAAAGARWDERTPWDRFVETASVPPQDLAPLLSPDKAIYWEGDIRVPWFVLKRASYFSCSQGAGVLFFRGTAIAYGHRFESFAPLRTMDFGEEIACPKPPASLALTPTRATLASLCEAEPELGSVVLTHPIAGAEPKIWAPPVPFETNRLLRGTGQRVFADRFYVYSCDDLR